MTTDLRELFEEYRFLRHQVDAGQTFGHPSVLEVARALRQLDVIGAVLPTGESQAVAPKSWRPSWLALPESRLREIVQRQADKGGRLDAVPIPHELLAARRGSNATAILLARLFGVPISE